MFRRSLRPPFLLVMALLAAAAPAEAVDVTEVTFDVRIERTSLGRDHFDVVVRVEGDALNNGTLAFPNNLGTTALEKDGADLVADASFQSQLALEAGFPEGIYTLRVNGNNVQATFLYDRPDVPDPDISTPDAGETLLPGGPVTLEFTSCPECNLAGDSVLAELEDDLGNPLDSEQLTETSESWTPQAGGGGDFLLPELSAFVARVTHSTFSESNVDASGDDADDKFIFSRSFVQSDEIDFETGFHTPTGDLCIAANHPAPPPGCKLVNDTLLQVLDTTGDYTTTVNGLDVSYSVSVASNGTLTGSANADLDDNGSHETVTPEIKGKLKGKAGELSSKLSFGLENLVIPAKLKLKITDLLSIPFDSIETTQKNSGSIGAVKVKEEILSSGPLPFTPLGWKLELAVDENTEVTGATLTLEGGRSFVLSGTNKFKFTSGESSLKLQSADKGIKIDLKKLVLDDTVNPVGVTGGSLSQKILGQSHKVEIP